MHLHAPGPGIGTASLDTWKVPPYVVVTGGGNLLGQSDFVHVYFPLFSCPSEGYCTALSVGVGDFCNFIGFSFLGVFGDFSFLELGLGRHEDGEDLLLSLDWGLDFGRRSRSSIGSTDVYRVAIALEIIF